MCQAALDEMHASIFLLLFQDGSGDERTNKSKTHVMISCQVVDKTPNISCCFRSLQ